jgi:hypothetical protein
VRRALAPAALLALAIPAALPACGAQPAKNPAYLLVELDPPPGLAAMPHAVRLQMTSTAKGVSPATLCLQLEPPGSATPASVALERAYGADATAEVTLEVTPFDALAGGSTGNQGQDFPCPKTLPPPLGPAQVVVVDFCAGKAQKIVFSVGSLCCPAPDGGVSDAGEPDAGEPPDAGGAGCGCDAAQVCGAGLGTDGYACAPGTCCGKRITSACALEPAP